MKPLQSKVTKGFDPEVFEHSKIYAQIASEIPTEYRYSHAKAALFSFSSELALKSLHMVVTASFENGEIIGVVSSKSPSGGHDLKKVFDNLPSATRETLSKKFEESDHHPGMPDTLEDALARSSVFADLRYYHEKSEVSYSGEMVCNTNEFLLKAIQELLEQGCLRHCEVEVECWENSP